MRNLDAAYIAGLFDGEGCVHIRTQFGRKNGGLRMCLEIVNVDPRPLRYVRRTMRVGTLAYRSNRKFPYWQYTVNGPDSTKFAKAVHPFTIIKYDELAVFIELRELLDKGRDYYRMPKGRMEIYEDAAERLAVLKAVRRN